jgi:BclB C-terminal domain-containing protein
MKNIYLTNVSVSSQKLKRASITILFALFALTVHAQVGIGTITPDGSAQLEISSPNKGLLIPRMLEVARNFLIPSPATGLLVYQTDGVAPGFYYYDGAAWQPLKGTAASGGGAIIPFASGSVPIVMTTLLGGLAGTASAVGFGNILPGIPILGSIIIDGATLNGNIAFSVPRAGAVSSISATFINTIAATLLGTVTVKAQIFRASAGTNTFIAVPAAEVVLPSFTGLLTVNQLAQGTASGLNIPVDAGDRLMLVFSCTEAGGVIVTSMIGHVSAGVEIK